MRPLPPGYFLTWHTYGTWLHGDDAGSVDSDHNRFRSPRLPPDPARFAQARHSLKNPPMVLSPTARILVDNIMRQHCRLRSWDLRALAVRSNHVHVVIANPLIEPEPIVKQLKDWGTRKLRSMGLAGPRRHIWADHASTVFLYEPGLVEEKTRYVLTMQDNVDESRTRPDWDAKLGLREP